MKQICNGESKIKEVSSLKLHMFRSRRMKVNFKLSTGEETAATTEEDPHGKENGLSQNGLKTKKKLP